LDEQENERMARNESRIEFEETLSSLERREIDPKV
jgi:hypothetical protein